MSESVVPTNEQERLDAVRRYEILDTPPDGAFDRIAALAARFLDVPIATVSIVDRDRIWFKATHGLDVEETGRDPGLCASVILQDAPYVVRDALKDPRAMENPLVRGELGLRFYAAAPITSRDGYNLGTVNVIDHEPREVDDAELATLADLAAVVAEQMELRLEARHTVELERTQRREAEQLTDLLQERLLPRQLPVVPGLDLGSHYHPVSPALDAGGDFLDVFPLDDGRWALVVGDVCGKGPRAAAVTGEIRHMVRALARADTPPSEVLRQLNDVLGKEGLDKDDPEERFCTACYAVVDTKTTPMEIQVCSGGHPLPLVRRADGRVEQVGQPGQLLGLLPDVTLADQTVALGEDDLLLLYTDGAIEQRGLSTDAGERALVRALQSAPATSAETAIGHVRDAVESQHDVIGDDIALLLGRVTSS